jgi:hypothetical protein
MVEITNFLNSGNLINIFIKVFSITLSFLYFIYALVIYNQTKIMTKTLMLDYKNIVLAISYFHIILGILLILMSFIII